MLADFCPRRGSLEVLGKGKSEFSKPQGQRLPGNSRLLICSSICCHRCHLCGREEGRWELGSGARSNPCSPAAAPSAPRAAGPASAAAPPGPGRGSCRNPGGSRRGTARRRGCQGHLKRLRYPQREREQGCSSSKQRAKQFLLHSQPSAASGEAGGSPGTSSTQEGPSPTGGNTHHTTDAVDPPIPALPTSPARHRAGSTLSFPHRLQLGQQLYLFLLAKKLLLFLVCLNSRKECFPKLFSPHRQHG